MKQCPLCHTKFDDSAEFCPQCKAQLEDMKEVEKAESGPVPKSFWIAVLWICGFIGAFYAFYMWLYGGFS